MKEIEEAKNAINNFRTSMSTLKELGVLINQHGFTAQIGEWSVEQIFEGERSKNGIQAGWDVCANGKYIQVKTHAKAENNNANFTAISRTSKTHIDELIILNFSPEYKLKEFYHVPWIEAVKSIKFSGKSTPREEINWSSVRQYKVHLDELPHQEIVKLFI